MPPRKKSSSLYILLLVLILLAAGVSYYYWMMDQAEVQITLDTPPTPAIAVDPAQERLQSLHNNAQAAIAALHQSQFAPDIAEPEQNALRQATDYLAQETGNPSTDPKLADYSDKILSYLMLAARSDHQITRAEFDYFRQKFQGRMAAYQTEDADLSAQNLKMLDMMGAPASPPMPAANP